jgi:hypothetical protein
MPQKEYAEFLKPSRANVGAFFFSRDGRQCDLQGSAQSVSISLMAADYFALGKTDAKFIFGMKRIAER